MTSTGYRRNHGYIELENPSLIPLLVGNLSSRSDSGGRVEVWHPPRSTNGDPVDLRPTTERYAMFAQVYGPYREDSMELKEELAYQRGMMEHIRESVDGLRKLNISTDRFDNMEAGAARGRDGREAMQSLVGGGGLPHDDREGRQKTTRQSNSNSVPTDDDSQNSELMSNDEENNNNNLGYYYLLERERRNALIDFETSSKLRTVNKAPEIPDDFSSAYRPRATYYGLNLERERTNVQPQPPQTASKKYSEMLTGPKTYAEMFAKEKVSGTKTPLPPSQSSNNAPYSKAVFGTLPSHVRNSIPPAKQDRTPDELLWERRVQNLGRMTVRDPMGNRKTSDGVQRATQSYSYDHALVPLKPFHLAPMQETIIISPVTTRRHHQNQVKVKQRGTAEDPPADGRPRSPPQKLSIDINLKVVSPRNQSPTNRMAMTGHGINSGGMQMMIGQQPFLDQNNNHVNTQPQHPYQRTAVTNNTYTTTVAPVTRQLPWQQAAAVAQSTQLPWQPMATASQSPWQHPAAVAQSTQLPWQQTNAQLPWQQTELAFTQTTQLPWQQTDPAVPSGLPPKRFVKGKYGRYRVFDVNDYKRLQKELRLGSLVGSDKDAETLQEKKEKRAILQEYGRLVRAKNREELKPKMNWVLS